MTEIKNFVSIARQRGVIDESTEQKLRALNTELAADGVHSGDHALFEELDRPNNEASPLSPEDREAPRFVRGFHDILITIGIVIALGGLWSLTHEIFVVVAIVGLAEYFVRRQRLALPAFTLTILLLIVVTNIVTKLVNVSNVGIVDDSNVGIVVFGAQLIALAAFYWRYRVPVALAGLIWSGFGLLFFAMLAVFSAGQPPDKFVEAYPRLVGILGLLLTLAMFLVAMRFDMKDRLRETRRSDVAFWLHLATAPLLLYSLFFILFGSDGFWWADKPNISEALGAIAMVTLMVLVGIVIDRRAFVTSGLISLGAALAIITRETGFDVSSVTAFAFMVVGVIVLLLGAGWQKLRAFVLGSVPDSWQAKLPPAAG